MIPDPTAEGRTRSLLRTPVALFLGIRGAFLLFTVLALLWVPAEGAGVPRFHAFGGLSDLVFGAFQHWDANWTIQIVQDGYTAQSAAFMPAYPALVWVGQFLVGSPLVAAVVISVVASAVGVHFVAAIATRIAGVEVGRLSVLLIAVYPIAFVFSAAYAEGLFLAAAAASVYAAMRERFWLAGLAAGFAVGTRSLGLALVPALLVLAWPAVRRHRFEALVPILAFPLAAVVIVMVWFQQKLGDALAFSHAQSYWDRGFSHAGPLGGLWVSVRAVVHGIGAIATTGGGGIVDHDAQLGAWNIVDAALLVVAIALTVVTFRRLGTALGVYSAGILLFSLSVPVTGKQEVLQSLSRFLLVDFPLFIAAATLLAKRPRARMVAVASLAAVGAGACIAFSRMLWVA